MGIFSDFFDSLFDDKPAFNIDGTLMCGDFDINGNAYGVTETDHSISDALSIESPFMEAGHELFLSESDTFSANDDCFTATSETLLSEDVCSSFSISDDLFSSDTFSCDTSSSWDD